MYKKSVLTLGFLLSSLGMLSAIPLLNNNPAMAQGYYDERYSQYPTDDKKYECRTGPFEGFFVSSVEFCKFKDDSKDNNRRGPQGIPGPAGPNEINQSLIYSIVGDRNTTNNLPLANADSIANCDMGDVAIGGKFNVASGGRDTIGGIRLLIAGTSDNLTSYETSIQTGLDGSVNSVRSTVVCFDNPPLRP